jgi:UPF0755 protein
MKKAAKYFLTFVLLLIVIAAAAGFYINRLQYIPYRSFSEPKIVVTIPQGSSLGFIVRTLHQKGVIQYPWLLRGIFYVHKTEGQSKAGDYVFDRAMSPMEVYEKLMKGEVSYTVVTIPEGSNIFDLQTILQEKQIATKEQFADAVKSPEVQQALHAIDPALHDPEGFLFPNTYFLSKRDTPANLLRIMLQEFSKHYGVAEKARAAQLQMSMLQLITLASLVEKETAQPKERPLIAGVFYNRLKKSMPLQCDPTVIYALLLTGHYRGEIYKSDLKTPSAYNTYVTPGLPPGPICNPGNDSIQAALNPDQTDKLYFVAKNDGTHYFSATLEEHNRAVKQYRK